MGIETKSLAFMIDQLITTDLRCWFAQERIMDTTLPESDRLAAAIMAQEQNSIRSKLMKAIDDRTGQENSMGGNKTYTYFGNKK